MYLGKNLTSKFKSKISLKHLGKPIIIDLNETTSIGHETPLVYVMKYNICEGYEDQNGMHTNIKRAQLEYLLKNTDLNIQDTDGNTALMYMFLFNAENNLNLTSEQKDFLIKNSNLKVCNSLGSTPLMLALRYNKDENLDLTTEQWNYLLENSDLSAKTSTQETILEFVYDNHATSKLNFNREQWKLILDSSQGYYADKFKECFLKLPPN